MTNDVIRVEVEDVAVPETTSRVWSEEISVKGSDLKDTVGRLAKEATVRKITIKNADGRTMLQIPLVLGAIGVLFIGPWTAVLLGGAWLAHYSILIEREGPAEAIAAARIEDSAGDVEDAIIIEKGPQGS